MKANILDLSGKKTKEIELPSFFSSEVREDIISKVLETKKTKQPYSPSLVAGKQSTAKGKVVHRRHVWRSGYGRGGSRVPRKVFSRRGSQFNWEAAEVPFARGGMRAHPPKILAMINTLKINKKEIRIAIFSALSATVNPKKIAIKYETLDEKALTNIPLVVKSDIVSVKTKELLSSLKKILGETLFGIAIQKKAVRSGKGKLRGRKYKKTAGLLLVVANDEALKTSAFDVVRVKDLSVIDLAKGGSGRLTMYTEKSIKDLQEKFK
ncbi:MAG TPA: 50S ribosomal protein L4 [Candidatus Pacearchaeota archaeon]|nr:50S ribosomal protein L4 [Candidatus Pacearchaeota archaeon]